jgi:dihydrodipicolinate reductase
MKESPVRVMLIGAAGRMGKTVLDLAQSDREIDIAARCDLGDPIEPAMKNCDVAIDFSQADSIDEVCRAALQHSEFQRGSQRALLADAKSCRIARLGFQS